VIWVSWRQHRSENVLIAILFALLAVLLVPTGLQIASAFDHGGLHACALDGTSRPLCGGALADFRARFSTIETLGNWLNLLPGLLGMLVAAPFVVELENGTYRLAWTQSITRRRWLAFRLAFITAGAIVLGVVFAVLFTWWRGPFDELGGRMSPNTFDLEGVAPAAYALFAAALVLAIGAITRRTAIAIGSAFGLYVAMRLGVQFWVREHLIAPTTTRWAPGGEPPAAVRDSWDLGTHPVDRLGRTITDPGRLIGPCLDKTVQIGANHVGAVSEACLRRHGVFNATRYIPADRFWALQGLESSLFVAAAIALVALTVWVVQRRLT
jgi:hypothetical protein